MSFGLYSPQMDCYIAQSYVLEGDDLIERIRSSLGQFSKGPFSLIEKRFRVSVWRLVDLVTDPTRDERRISDVFIDVEVLLDAMRGIQAKKYPVAAAVEFLGLNPNA